MNRKQLGSFKFLLFLAGFGIIALAYYLLNPEAGEAPLSDIDKFKHFMFLFFIGQKPIYLKNRGKTIYYDSIFQT